MRLLQIIVAFLISGTATVIEFRSIKAYALFFDWPDSIPFFALCIFTFVFFLLNVNSYANYRQLRSFLPLLICLSFLMIISWHKKERENSDNSATNFTATTYQIGSDGGLIFDFKKNGHLKAERRDHWAVTHYWGTYSINKDTVVLDIPLNFKLGRQAILTDSSMRFFDDTIRFQVYRQ